MNDQAQTKTDLIERRIDRTVTGELAIGGGGNLDFANLGQIMEVAKVMATSKCAIPGHLRDNPGACLAVAIQASEWQMSPFAVANKTYVVSDRLSFEAQLVAAVILMRAPIKGRLKYRFTGEGPTRKCFVSCVLKDDDGVLEHESPEFQKIKVKNSPLWQNDPDQQLGYYTARAMARRHFPDILLGVYTPEEMAEQILPPRDVTPDAPAKPKFLDGAKKCDGNHAEPPCPDPECWLKSEAPSFTDAAPQEESPPDDTDQRNGLLQIIESLRTQDNLTVKQVREWAFRNKLCESDKITLASYTTEGLKALVERWNELTGGAS